MSWQCPYCETVNQDAVPYCTVCDRIAPVIESFLSLEQIENAGLYNDKLDKIHQHESKAEYELMLEAALEAIKLYKENDLAVAKLQVAVKRILESNMACEFITLIERHLENYDFLTALNIITIWEKLQPEDDRIKSYKTKISEAEENERKIKAEAEKTKLDNSNKQRKFPRPTRTNTEDVVEASISNAPRIIPNNNKRKFPKVKRDL